MPPFEEHAGRQLRLGSTVSVAHDASRPSVLHSQQRRSLYRSAQVRSRDLARGEVDRLAVTTACIQGEGVRIRAQRSHRPGWLVGRKLGRALRIRLGECGVVQTQLGDLAQCEEHRNRVAHMSCRQCCFARREQRVVITMAVGMTGQLAEHDEAGPVVRRRVELERSIAVPDHRVVVVASGGLRGRVDEYFGGRNPQRGVGFVQIARQIERNDEVVRDLLAEEGPTRRAAAQPRGGPFMAFAPAGARELAVRNLADERVRELDLGGALDRRRPAPHDELQPVQLRERALVGVGSRAAVVESTHGLEPGNVSENCRALHEPFRPCVEPVDARRDQALDGVGNSLVGSTLGDRACVLEREQRIPRGLMHQPLLDVGRERHGPEAVAHDRRNISRGQRSEVDALCDWYRCAPLGLRHVQFGSRGRHNEQRRIDDAAREVMDEFQQRAVSPMNVVEYQYRRATACDRSHEHAPTGDRIAPRFQRELGVESEQHADLPAHEASVGPVEVE